MCRTQLAMATFLARMKYGGGAVFPRPYVRSGQGAHTPFYNLKV